MKRILLLFLFILFSFNTYSQFNQYPGQDEGHITGGLGLMWIDGKPHYRFSFRPEVSFANFGVGLDLNLDFDSDGNIRKENFNETSDYLSLIRYMRYGIKNDPVYIKVGALDYHTLGHGTIMYLYNNSPSFDSRRIGMVLDIDFGNFGFESVYSQFAEAGVAGLRGYVRPLQFTDMGIIPVIGGVEFGASFVSDFHKNAGIINGFYSTGNKKFETLRDEGSMSIVGFDIGFPIVRTAIVDVTLYADYSKIIDFGSGVAAGIKTEFNGLGLVSLFAKLERRFNNKQYIPSYFNSFYEIERFKVDTSSGSFSSKARMLAGITETANGFYGELGVNVLGLFNILGSYQRLDKYPDSGILHLSTEIAPEEAPFVARAGYDKINIMDEVDLFKLDDRSYLFFELGYKPYPFLLVSMIYHWTFAPVRDAGDNILEYTPQKRIEPRISFIYPFGL